MTPEVKKAHLFASIAHEGQFRKSGEPYITHPEAVSQIISDEWEIQDKKLICAALLHDTVEDTDVTLEKLGSEFGVEVAKLVNGVSHLKGVSDKEAAKKVAIDSFVDIRVLLLKLADRLHNMRTLNGMPESKRIKKSEETMVYASMAESLGLWIVKTELEDLSFYHRNKTEYEQVVREIESDPRLDKLFLTHYQSNLLRLSAALQLLGQVNIRKNGYWNLKQKRLRAAINGLGSPDDFASINDLVSFRVTLSNIYDCYAYLGLLHQELGNIVDYGQFNEFTGANTRLNGYAAIQTTLKTPQGIVEVAITTNDFEEFNQWGVISLIRNGEKNLSRYSRKINFTPSGDVIFTPNAANACDFAYSINPRLGADAIYALIDGQQFPLSTVIPNGATVEIVVGEPRISPGPDIVDYCLPVTQNIIKKQILQEERHNLTRNGANKIEIILIKQGLPNLEDIKEIITKTLYQLGCESLDELYYRVGIGSVPEDYLINLLSANNVTKEQLKLTTIRLKGKDKPGVLELLSSQIKALNGNITHMHVEVENSAYYLRIVISGFVSSSEESMAIFISEHIKKMGVQNWSVS